MDEPKLMTLEEMRAERNKLVAREKKLVCTNGCFAVALADRVEGRLTSNTIQRILQVRAKDENA